MSVESADVKEILAVRPGSTAVANKGSRKMREVDIASPLSGNVPRKSFFELLIPSDLTIKELMARY